MNRIKKPFALMLVFAMLIGICSCAESRSGHVHRNSEPSKPEATSETFTSTPSELWATPTPTDDEIVDFTFFSVMYGTEKSEYNEIKEIIAKLTGVRVNECWNLYQGESEAVGSLMASGDLPDFIDAGDSSVELYEGGYLVAWDPYLELYPNLKELYTEEEWENFRMPDGHIYWANVFDNFYEKDTTAIHNGPAFWIQARVLEWAGYPKIETLDQYFDLLERYYEANPEMPDGTPIIPYTCICESWRYYSLEGAPLYLDGYEDNRCVIVNVDDGVDNPVVEDYNTTDTAKSYFRKLNEEYYKGILDPDFAVQTYDEYIAKLSTGCVLGMCDQYWDFAYTIDPAFDIYIPDGSGTTYTPRELGCDYVPLGLVSEAGMSQQYHSYSHPINYASGIAVTTSCYDPDLAFYFLNELLSQEIHDLRFWGIEGVDYYVSSDGTYFRTMEQRETWSDSTYRQSHSCEYSYFPQWHGMSKDGINCMMPSEQPNEFLETLPKSLYYCFEAYGVSNYVEMVGSVECEPNPWYPLYTWSNNLTDYTPEGSSWASINECKHEWLPKVILSSDFDSAWDEYMSKYEEGEPQIFIDAAQKEVEYRLENG